MCVPIFGSYAQTYEGLKGYGVYKPYDKSYINPEIRGKHCISLGGIGAINTPFPNDFEPTFGVHVGYNYLVLEKRKRLISHKKKMRTEIKHGLGLHVNVLQNQELYIMATYTNPLFSLRGLLGFYFFSEYGLGIHKSPTLENQETFTRFNASVEVIRIRFSRSPLNIHFTTNYSLQNDLLGKNRLDVGFMGGLRYYFYKVK